MEPVLRRPTGWNSRPLLISLLVRKQPSAALRPWLGLSLVLVVFTIARCWISWWQRFDSDELQHAHVAWCWLSGYVPYRDFFDNHTPLFHILAIPGLAWIGESPAVLGWLRIEIIFPNLVLLTVIYLLASRFYSWPVGLWSVILLASFPKFFLDAGEFRTDVLWALGWVITFWIITGRSRYREFFAGLTAGICLAISLKTVFLLAVLAVAIFLRRIFANTRPPDLRSGAGQFARFAAGFLIVPVLLFAYLLNRGAGPEMYGCLFSHNVSPESASWQNVVHHLADPRFWTFLIPFFFLALRRFASFRPSETLTLLDWFNASYCPILLGSGIGEITKQDYLPFYPLLLIWVAGVLVHYDRHLRFSFLCSTALLLNVFWIGTDLYRRETNDPINAALIANARTLVRPDEFLLDAKGETMFRQRAVYDVFERFTQAQYRAGKRIDRAPETLVARKTMLVVKSERYPGTTQSFILSNYLSCGRFWLAGGIPETAADGSFRFEIGLAGTYALLGQRPGSGELVKIARFELLAGPFTYRTTQYSSLLLFWERAWDSGFRPDAHQRQL